jgi:acylphosphatase
MVRITTMYTGRVQGVGFRWTARDLSAGFAVTGYVRNLPDGRVELVAEGEAGEVRAFLAKLAGRMGGNIESTEVREEPASGEWGMGEFEVRR